MRLNSSNAKLMCFVFNLSLRYQYLANCLSTLSCASTVTVSADCRLLFLVQTLKVTEQQEVMAIFDDDMYEFGCNDPKSDMGDFPPRRMSVKSFKIDKHPVTNGDFA